tara:strand:+ start:81 stop:638 length:558 start_codon:yes stop_codon:yes gene_type:complete
MSKKTVKTTNLEDTIDHLVDGCDLLMLDEPEAHQNPVSGEENPKYQASAIFLFGGRARKSAREVIKKQDYLDTLEAKIASEEENNGPESSKLIGLRKGLRKAEAELATAKWLWTVDVSLFNVMVDHMAWNDGKVTEDLGVDWYSMQCDKIMERKVLSPQAPTSDEIAQRMAERKARIKNNIVQMH